MIILAVDVGIQVCGYAVCALNGTNAHLIKQGEIKPKKADTLPQKLNSIIEELERVVKEVNPQAVVVETLYSHHKHPATLGVLAQVKGTIAVFSCRWGVDYAEYSSTRARKSFVGKGDADSLRVKKMAESVTGIVFKSVHTADAYSLAFAYAHEQGFKRLLEKNKG